MKIKTIDIQGKLWFDAKNGNTYFAATVTINYKMKGEQSFYVPFQYGYNDSYQFESMRLLQSKGYIKNFENIAPWRYCNENGIILRAHKWDVTREELAQFEANNKNL